MMIDAGTHLATNTLETAAAGDDLGELSGLSDGDLLANTRKLVGRSNQLLAALLLHLGEVEARGLHRTRACASAYTFCIYDLRLSEDEAYRRVAAARLVRRFPALFAAVAKGELHLTGLLLLGPHLTPENLGEVLARARHRTKKEIAKLIRELSPLPDVPARIEPLGPAPARLVPNSPTWEQWVTSLCPVRELPAGDRPVDWVDGANDATGDESQAGPESAASAPARGEAVAPSLPQRFKVEFTAGEEYVSLVERAKALLSHALPGVALEEIHLRAMRLLVAELEKRKYAVTARPSKRQSQASNGAPALGAAESPEAPSERGTGQQGSDEPVRRKRTVPAPVRRAVLERDGGRCTYVDDRGERCRETHWLELHHLQAFARGGQHTATNLTLRCTAHNALAAEADFGRDFMADRRAGKGHESAASVAAQLLGHPARDEDPRALRSRARLPRRPPPVDDR